MTTFHKQRFADNIRAKRKAAGLTQAQLAQAIGRSACTIWNYEAADSCPSVADAAAIAQATQCSLMELIGNSLGEQS